MFDLIFLSTLNFSDTSFYLRSQNTRNVLNHDTKEEIKFLSCKGNRTFHLSRFKYSKRNRTERSVMKEPSIGKKNKTRTKLVDELALFKSLPEKKPQEMVVSRILTFTRRIKPFGLQCTLLRASIFRQFPLTHFFRSINDWIRTEEIEFNFTPYYTCIMQGLHSVFFLLSPVRHAAGLMQQIPKK